MDIFYPDAKFVQLDTSPQVVMGTGRVADCYIQSDAPSRVEVIDRKLERTVIHSIGYQTVEVKERLATAWLDPGVFEPDPGTMDPRDAVLTVDQMIPEEMGFISGAGHQAGFAIDALHQAATI